MEDAGRYARSSFAEEGLSVMLLGQEDWTSSPADLAGSEYLHAIHNQILGRPRIRLSLEKAVQGLCRRAIERGIVSSAHDCSDGGLAVALAECCVSGAAPSATSPVGSQDWVGFLGGSAFTELPRRWDVALFGEAQSRIVVSLPKEQRQKLGQMALESGVPFIELGVTGGQRLSLGPRLDLALTDVAEAWGGGLDRALEG